MKNLLLLSLLSLLYLTNLPLQVTAASNLANRQAPPGQRTPNKCKGRVVDFLGGGAGKGVEDEVDEDFGGSEAGRGCCFPGGDYVDFGTGRTRRARMGGW